MSRVTDAQQQLVRWLQRMFLPSTPAPTTPSEIDEVMKLVIPALPPSLAYERMAYQTGVTVNPGTQLFFPSTTGKEAFGATEDGVSFGEFYWVLAARFEQSVAAVTGAGRSFIGLKHVGDTREVGCAQSLFSTTSLTDFCELHSIVNSNTTSIMGGGGGPIVIPPTYNLHFSTAATPGATTLFNATIVYCRMKIGELHP